MMKAPSKYSVIFFITALSFELIDAHFQALCMVFIACLFWSDDK